jgi:hypothetical protein
MYEAPICTALERIAKSLELIVKALEKISTANIIHMKQGGGETNTPVFPPCQKQFQEPDGNTPPDGLPPAIFGTHGEKE